MKKVIIIILVVIVLISGYFIVKDFYKQEVNNSETVIKPQKLFAEYYNKAEKLLNTMTIDEKISQMLLVRHPSTNDIEIQKQYQFGGFVFFSSDFKNKSKDEVVSMINNLQNNSKIPLLTAIDEEGGTVSRISSNSNLVSEPFKSPQELYKENGYDAIYDDVINKSQILHELGLNLNLAPVVDVSTDPNDYIYKRTLGMDTEHTNTYAETVIKASKNNTVSYTLKHFPGYGSNKDTHKTESIDIKSYEDIQNEDLPPFISGINAGAEAVMVSHNTVTSIDDELPASLSLKVHNILLNDLKFSGIIITDDISMNALDNISDIEIKAIKAKNNLLITSDYQKSFNNIKNGLENNLLTEDEINDSVLKILAWKYYKKLM